MRTRAAVAVATGKPLEFYMTWRVLLLSLGKIGD